MLRVSDYVVQYPYDTGLFAERVLLRLISNSTVHSMSVSCSLIPKTVPPVAGPRCNMCTCYVFCIMCTVTRCLGVQGLLRKCCWEDEAARIGASEWHSSQFLTIICPPHDPLVSGYDVVLRDITIQQSACAALLPEAKPWWRGSFHKILCGVIVRNVRLQLC
jgi:hypothetical protein